MGFFDIFKVKQYKEEIENAKNKISMFEKNIIDLQHKNLILLREKSEIEKQRDNIQKQKEAVELEKFSIINENNYIKSLFTCEQLQAININDTIIQLQKELNEITQKVYDERCLLYDLESQKQQLNNELIELSDEILYQNFNLYEPKYKLMNCAEYKEQIELIRLEQKSMIKDKTAVTCSTEWTVNNSVAQGRKMINDNIRQVLRSFNSECDYIISKLTFNNYDSIKKRITKSAETLNKLNASNCITIEDEYINLKYKELDLVMEYNIKKEEEKEQIRLLKEQQREEALLLKEIEANKRKIEKEQKHFENALEKIEQQIEKETNIEQIEVLIEKKTEITNSIIELDTALEEVDNRETNQKAGYVYIISNIGAFGENIYKIGMTRRLNPQDRIDELSSASVPFKFDVHAMIFSEDAPALEAKLHKQFEKNKVNLVNSRKEFFNVSLDEIKKCVSDNFDKTVEFIDIPSAEQYRETLLLRSKL